MTSEAETEEMLTHHPADLCSVQHVDSGTISTEEFHRTAKTISTKQEETCNSETFPNSPEQQSVEALEVEVVSPMLVLTESIPSDTTNTADDVLVDTASAVSMPTTLPSTTADNAAEATGSSFLSPHDTDAVTVASAPAVVVDIAGDIGNAELEDIMSSPHGKNAIVERSPGGRYLRFMEKLGSGASKDVYRAYDTQEGIEVAWNVVHLAGVPKNDRNRIVNEVRLLERLHHHNIISFHGSWVNREKQQVNFVTEILSSGTLQSFINKVQVIRWKIAKRWALQILKGLEYLHSQEPPVIHRDLKCQNIFINGTSGDLRIGDLGLSTVHRNGKALSVLGTPEFMAPDMYEEIAYDEKVDIYAFGMCLLEIFTKEIPYRECNNPAQIYKKVIRGDPPDCLRRLKSRHARDFINLCLGTKDEDGRYIRPSATELIAHPFLQLRPSDDDEVEVDAPMQEKTIREVSESTSGGGIKISISQVSKACDAINVTVSSSPMNKPQHQSSNSLEGDESDRFDEMPDNETGFRKPKVLMGRGQELQRDANAPVPGNEVQVSEVKQEDHLSVTQVPALMVPLEAPSAPLAQNSEQVIPVLHQAPTPSPSPAPAFHFLVAAAVIEDEFSTSRPYDDDVLKLVVTLPVEGQTQNVQFDFHLVEDDPIQVAKEMVAELGIPQAAVLEISETISGLARAARIKQEKYIARMNMKPIHHRSRSASQAVPPQKHGSDVILPQSKTIGHGPNTVQSQNHPPLPDYMSAPPMQGQHMGQPLQQQQGLSSQDQSPHLHGQQVSMSQMQLQSQHYPAGDSPLNSHLQSHPFSQQMNQTDHNPAQMGHGQAQPNWNHHVAQNTPPSGAAPSETSIGGQQTYGHSSQLPIHTPIVRSMSGTIQSEISTTAPAYSQAQNGDGQGSYSQVPVQHLLMSNQQQAQIGGQQGMMQQAHTSIQQQHGDGQSVYNQIPMQHLSVSNQQVPGGPIQNPQTSNQQNSDGQNFYGQNTVQHGQNLSQQQAQNVAHLSSMQTASSQMQAQNADGQNVYSQVALHQGQLSNQQQAYAGGQQGMLQHAQSSNQQQAQNDEGQNVYGQALMQQMQVSNQQPSQIGGQQSMMQQTQTSNQQNNGDGQSIYNHVSMHQMLPPNQHLSQIGGPQGLMQQTHASNQQHNGDVQSVYSQVSLQQVQVSNQQQAPNGGQQGMMQRTQASNHQQSQNDDLQNVYGDVPIQQVHALNQQQNQVVGQQGTMQYMQGLNQQYNGDGQSVNNSVTMHHVQTLNQQNTQNEGHHGSNPLQPQNGDGQSVYSQLSMHHGQSSSQQQMHSGEQLGSAQQTQVSNQLQPQNGERQNVYIHPPVQQVQISNQQHMHSGGQQGFDGQIGYAHLPLQQGQLSNHQQTQGGVQQAFIHQSQGSNLHQTLDSQAGYGLAPGHIGQVPNQQQVQNREQHNVDGKGAYGQTPMQHVQLPKQYQAQSGPQQRATQNHDQVALSAPFVPQSQPQVPASSQMQGNLLSGNYQASVAGEMQGQSQFMQNSQSSLQQHPGNPHHEMQLMSQNVHNPSYGQPMSQQQQQSQPLAPPLQQHQSQSVHSPYPQGSVQPSQQQPIANQQHVMQSQQGSLGVPQLPATPGISQNQTGATMLPTLEVNVDVTPRVLGQTPARPALVKETASSDPRPTLAKQSSTLSDDVNPMDNPMNGVHEVLSFDINDDLLDDDELLAAELRKLDEDFQKNMMRAQKVFDTRMDTLQRTQVQREALHQKTLEKHEKERADFEKRRQQEEIEQNRRIEQLQKDWARRREAMRQKQLAEAQEAEAALSAGPN